MHLLNIQLFSIFLPTLSEMCNWMNKIQFVFFYYIYLLLLEIHFKNFYLWTFQKNVKKATEVLIGLLHLIVVIGMVISVFAAPYSYLAVAFYGGDLLVKNSGSFFRIIYVSKKYWISLNELLNCQIFLLRTDRILFFIDLFFDSAVILN